MDEKVDGFNHPGKTVWQSPAFQNQGPEEEAGALISTLGQGELTVSLTGAHGPPCERISRLISQFIGQDSSWLCGGFLPSCVPVERISCRKNDPLGRGRGVGAEPHGDAPALCPGVCTRLGLAPLLPHPGPHPWRRQPASLFGSD